jgi:glycerate kinase
MHILIAPNSFKYSLSASEAAMAIKEGLENSRLKCTTECFPVGDGGDGTGILLSERLKGRRFGAKVHDPLGKEIISFYSLTDDHTAIIELADASGLRLLKKGERNPLHATTYGTGELIRHALDHNVRKIVLCIGGSATVDGGTGILQALGIRLLDKKRNPITDLPIGLKRLKSIDDSALDKRILTTELIILCDVENPLLGENGAAAVFGPQKGAGEKQVRELERILYTFSEVTLRHTGKETEAIKYGGAAGGTAAGLFAYLNAYLKPGIDQYLEIAGFDQALAAADLVITGEGSIDEQTLRGKGPMGVAIRAKQKGLPVIAIAGKIPLDPKAYAPYFDVLLPINHKLMKEKDALLIARDNIKRTSEMIGNLMAGGKMIDGR